MKFQRGTLNELVPLIEQVIAELIDIPPRQTAGVLAVARIQEDRIDEARQLLEEFAAVDFDLPLDSSWLTAMMSYAEAAIACRDPRHAEPLFTRLAPWADQMSMTGGSVEGPVSYALGGLATVLGRYDTAEAYFAQAAAFSDGAGATFFAARTDLARGSMLAERGAPCDAEEAGVLLTRARRAAGAHGYADVERRANKALRHLS